MIYNFFNGFKKGFTEFGHNISLIVNTILLLFVYIFGVGPTSVFAKIVGKHFLEKKLNKNDTYWNDLDLGKKDVEDYYRQF